MAAAGHGASNDDDDVCSLADGDLHEGLIDNYAVGNSIIFKN